MAVGLSSSFIEPLESTSLYVALLQFGLFKHYVNELENPNEHSTKTFNNIVNNIMDDILAFIYLHYMTKRNDSDFWKNLRSNYSVPDRLQNILVSIENRDLRLHQLAGNPFSLSSHLHICNGLGLFVNGINTSGFDNVVPSNFEYDLITTALANKAVEHSVFLKSLKEKYKQSPGE